MSCEFSVRRGLIEVKVDGLEALFILFDGDLWQLIFLKLLVYFVEGVLAALTLLGVEGWSLPWLSRLAFGLLRPCAWLHHSALPHCRPWPPSNIFCAER